MEPFINNIELAVSNVDTTVGDVLQDKYFFIISIVLILLLGSLNSTIVNKQIFYLYDNSLTRLVIMGLIYYVSTKNASLAILMLSSLLISMNTYNKYKFNLLLMTMMDNDNYNRIDMRSMKINFRRLVQIVSNLKRAERIRRASRRSSIRNKNLKKLDTLKRKKVKKLFDSLKIIYNSLIGKNRVPSKLTKLAVKAKEITKRLKKKTPKIIKLIAQKIKDIAKSLGKSTPKIVGQLSSTLGIKDIIIPNTLLKKLLEEKKITSDEAIKLRKLTPKSILKLLKDREREIKRIPKKNIVSTPVSKVSTPVSKFSTPVSKFSTPVSKVSTPVSKVSSKISLISKTPSVSSKSKVSTSPSVSITPTVSVSSSRTITK
jgi:hypothetical protein